MERPAIKPSMKLADLLGLNYRLLNVLSRLGISLGFGEQTIAGACRQHGISPASFLLVCNQYTFEDYVPSRDLLKEASPVDVMLYLHNSHLDYMQDEMTSLEASLKTLMEPTEVKNKKVVEKFFQDYKTEVRNHFDYEEQVVFPYVNAVMQGRKQEGYSIDTFEQNHSNIDEKLNDLKNIVMKYLPESCDPILRNRVLYHIFTLEEDLGIHTMVEDNILVPMVNMIEHDGC